MANEVLRILQGTKAKMPAALTPGTIYITTDTNEMYVDLSTTSRIFIKDASKLASNANAVSASKLLTARTISLAGALTGSATFDGSANVTITAALSSSASIDDGSID